MSDFRISFEDFKRMVAELSKAIDARESAEAIDAGLKCVTLHYLNHRFTGAEELIVISYFMWVATKANRYLIEEELNVYLNA